jgi:REP element-mobilizing transposase RayT
MPRKARIDAPGALHHIIARGIERKPIFSDSQDYDDFLERMGDLLQETGISCYAWALMPNHVHLLLKTGSEPLATLMRRLLGWHAQHFNHRHKRHGHLFQNRYKSILCEEDAYLLELVRYIHLNPLRAGVVKNLDELNVHPLSGHGVVMGNILQHWQDVDHVLGMFGRGRKRAREAYFQFVGKGVSKGRRPDLVGGGLRRSMGAWAVVREARRGGQRIASDERILGSGEFVEAALAYANESLEKRTWAKAKGLSFDRLVFLAADRFGVDESAICSPVRKKGVSRVRAIVCHLASARLGMKGVDVARKLHLTPSAVCKLAAKGRKDQEGSEIESLLFKEGTVEGP